MGREVQNRVNIAQGCCHGLGVTNVSHDQVKSIGQDLMASREIVVYQNVVPTPR
jgi:hypothetical protein